MAVKWLPAQEKNRVISIVSVGKATNLKNMPHILTSCPIAGAQAGMIFGLMTSGYIADALGWEAIFYFVGTCGCIWFLLWVFLAYNSPADHPRISTVKRTKLGWRVK